MVEDRCRWLASLLGACDRGLVRLRAAADPPLDLVRDLERLRASLLAQLEALKRSRT